MCHQPNPPTEEPSEAKGTTEESPQNSGKDLTAEQQEEIERLEAMGYVTGSQPVPETDGVIVYDPSRTFGQTNLLVSGHDCEALLVDMQGNTIHHWKCYFDQLWPSHRLASLNANFCFQRAYLGDNGELLAIYHTLGLVKLDKDSKVLWASLEKFHHDLEVLPDGRVYILTQKAWVVPRFHPEFPILEDFVCVLDYQTGEELDRLSLLEAFENSEYARFLEKGPKRGDITHTNTIEYLDGSKADIAPMYQEGNVLISCRELGAIAVVDLEARKVVWAAAGPWRQQHCPTLLDNGHILLFDNMGLGERSRVLEYDPLTESVVWSYGEAEGESFYTATCGTCQRLPNGNTLIVESQGGRAFEVAPDKTVVWEYVNPHKAGKNKDKIAAIFDMVRLDPTSPLQWLE